MHNQRPGTSIHEHFSPEPNGKPLPTRGERREHAREVSVNRGLFGFTTKVAGEGDGTQSGFGLMMLRGLGARMDRNGRAQHIYGGTVPEGIKQRRRAANKVARRSRRANRRG